MNTKDKFVKILLLFVGAYLFLPFCFAFASLEINEIMYDFKTGSDEGREWVEIFNNSETAVDVTLFKFFEEDTNHRLKLVQGNSKIQAKTYALIVSDPTKFKDSYPDFYGTIFDSSFSLHNSGETLAIKKGEEVVDQYSYQSSSGGAGDGQSLQKINGIWRGAVPTPGRENKISYTTPSVPKSSTKISGSSPGVNENGKNKTVETTNLPSEVLPDNTTEENSGNSYLFVTIFVVFVGLSAGAVYFIRRKKNVSKPGEDFELLN